MHHFIFPTQDTWITNKTNYSRRNFGLDEILQIGVSGVSVVETLPTKNYSYLGNTVERFDVDNFTGVVTGSFECGNVGYSSGSISGQVAAFTTSYFTGSLTASINGSQFTGSLTSSFSGSISSSYIDGLISGSVIVNRPGIFTYFTGTFLSASGIITGWISGSETKNQQNITVRSRKYIDRSLLKFDLTNISKSISNGEISNPAFSLKLKTSEARELPLSYKIYAYPISQSWQMGNGYYSDGGSIQGANWYYHDNDLGNQWWVPSTQSLNTEIYDYLNNEVYATESFKYGGSTWYYSGSNHIDNVLQCTQSFDYESSDIDLDITKIVMSWISGSIPNEGILLMHSDEISTTSSYANLKLFSKDTNTIYSPKIDAKWDDSIWSIGEDSTGSVVLSYTQSGITGSVVSGSTFTISGGLSGAFESFIFFTLDGNSLSGFINGTGSAGSFLGVPIYGNVTSSWLNSDVSGSCGKVFNTTILSGSFISGPYSGSEFYSYYDDGKIWNGWVTGSWSSEHLLNMGVNIILPAVNDPYTFAYVYGNYINGNAFGIYSISGSNSSSFNGQLIDGNYAGGNLFVHLTGNIYTSSFYTTQSVSIITSSLSELNLDRPFSVIIKNLLPEYKNNNIVKVGVFGRTKYPLKNFTKSTQPLSYIVPEYLPTSSYYSIKDNETEEILVDFDNYSKMSCSYPIGNFFMLDTTGLPQERKYRILTKIESGSVSYVFDNGDIFKIKR